MHSYQTLRGRIFDIVNYTFLIGVALMCVFPNALTKPQFLTSFVDTLERVGLGLAINMLLTICAAYPLSKKKGELYGRDAYAWYLIVTIIFSGGMIPWYMTIKQFGLMGVLWALILFA